MKLLGLIKKCLTERQSRVREGNNFSDMFPIRNVLKERDVSSPFLFNFDLEYASRRVQANEDVLKLNGAHQVMFMLMILIYWVGVCIL